MRRLKGKLSEEDLARLREKSSILFSDSDLTGTYYYRRYLSWYMFILSIFTFGVAFINIGIEPTFAIFSFFLVVYFFMWIHSGVRKIRIEGDGSVTAVIRGEFRLLTPEKFRIARLYELESEEGPSPLLFVLSKKKKTGLCTLLRGLFFPFTGGGLYFPMGLWRRREDKKYLPGNLIGEKIFEAFEKAGFVIETRSGFFRFSGKIARKQGLSGE